MVEIGYRHALLGAGCTSLRDGYRGMGSRYLIVRTSILYAIIPLARVPVIRVATIRTGAFEAPFRSHLCHFDQPFCDEPHFTQTIGLNIRQTGIRAILAFRQRLHNVSCHDWGWGKKLKCWDSGTRYDRDVVPQHAGPRRTGPVVVGDGRQCRSDECGWKHRRGALPQCLTCTGLLRIGSL